MPAPDSNSDDLLRFARETPFTFGSWRDVKSLYKRLEAEPASAPTALAALIRRLDAASLVPVRDIPTAELGLSYNTGTPAAIDIRGTRMAVLTQGWQSSGIYLYDFSSPDVLKPRTVGKVTRNGRGDWDEVVFAGDNLLCIRCGDQQLRFFDVSVEGAPLERSRIPEKVENTSSQRGQTGGIGFLAAAEQMIRGAFGVGATPATDKTVALANIQGIAATDRFVYAACGAVPGKNPTSLGGLCVIDISDANDPQVIGTVPLEDAERVCLIPGRAMVAVLSNPRNRGRQTPGILYLIDISNPQQPQIVGNRTIAHGSALTASEDYLYVATTAQGRGASQGVTVVDITNPRSPRVSGNCPIVGYYGVEYLAERDGYVYASLRYGRIQVIDARDPAKPERLRELAPSYIKALKIVGDRMYTGVGASVALWSLQTPDRPTLIGTPPSAPTLGYMKRRARRLLKNLAKSDPALFTEIAAQILSEQGKTSNLDWATNWIVVDLLFGESGRIDQVSHGRGRMVETHPARLRIRRREERGRAAWDAYPERAASVWAGPDASWQAREMVLKVLRASGRPVPALSSGILPSCLTAPSPLLIAEGVRQSVERLQSGKDLHADIAAEAFAKASPRQRTLLLTAILNKAANKADWSQRFTEALLARLPDPSTDGRRPTKRTVAVALALFENFGDTAATAKDHPVLRLVPLLLSSGQPLLREQAISAASRITPIAAYDWLPNLATVADSEDREQILVAMETAIRGAAVPKALEAPIQSTLWQSSSPVAAWAWRLLAALAPTADFLRSLWTTLLSDTTLETALGVAMASPYALNLLGRSGITTDEMSVYLQERPQLIGLLSAQSFAVLTQTMPAPVTLRMIAAASDNAWTRLREGWLRNLREGIGVNALWTGAEAALKADETGNLERRLIDDGDVAGTIVDADDFAGILAIREPSLAPLLAAFIGRHLDKIAASDPLLLTAATHPLPEVRAPALAALQQKTIRLPMALGLLESEVPASMEAGQRWFNDINEPDLLTRALALCDSPVASVRAIGRTFVTEKREQLPMDELSAALVEHADPKMQEFVAHLLGNEPAPQFDREVLRTRNKSRAAKETVKTRQEVLASADGEGAVDTETLLALARGASTPRDSDWALTQLVRRALAGEVIDGLTLEGTAHAVPGRTVTQMEVTQAYAHPSTATFDNDGMKLAVSAELSRPGVRLDARIKDSLGYARVMLALYNVVSSDLRSQPKDHSAYQAWVQERYLEELSDWQAEQLRALPGLEQRRNFLTTRVKDLGAEIRPLESTLQSAEFFTHRRKYFDWLYKNDSDAWWILDPVVSVHPDAVVFEVFSQDESSYGRVTVPGDKLEMFGETIFGTTNVDYSRALADEIRRVRSYRPAFLSVAAVGVTLATGAGERVEKKIDLPPTWVRGFLQVQSASVYPGVDVTLSPTTLADVFEVLQRRREKEGPRSLKFKLTPGERPSIVVEPWGVEIHETTHIYEGPSAQEIRIWGRRRLLTMADLMPYADSVTVRMLGTGMPSYWSVTLQGHRFDLGVSGWTKNDWSSAARFDLLAAVATPSEGDVAVASAALEKRLRLTPEEMAQATDLPRDTATAALQELCRQGMAMYDIVEKHYRWRQLLPFPVPPPDESDQRSRLAARIIATGGVTFKKPGEDDENDTFSIPTDEKVTRFRVSVRGGESKRERKFHVTIDLDADGRVRFANCDCAWHRREKLRKGPCAHILAASALASKEMVKAAVAATADDGGGSGVLSPDRFKDMTFVFTGALTLFTREQAEAMVEQAGGKASGSVSKNTTYLVAGDKAGSKLAKANSLGVPVLTEQQFQNLLEGKTV